MASFLVVSLKMVARPSENRSHSSSLRGLGNEGVVVRQAVKCLRCLLTVRSVDFWEEVRREFEVRIQVSEGIEFVSGQGLFVADNKHSDR